MIVLGLGTNLGDKKQNLKEAIRLLNLHKVEFLKSSSIYESEAWGFETENTFFNCCIIVKTEFSPEELLKICKAVELSMGRTVKKENSSYISRIIDIDILFYNKEVINTLHLQIPHALIAKRKFVLTPLIDLNIKELNHFYQKEKEQLLLDSNDDSAVFVVDSPFFVNEI